MKIYCENLKRYLPVEGGATLAEIYSSVAEELGFTPICASVNNKTEDLSFPVFSPKMVKFLPADSPTGRRVYVRTLCMMLYKAVTEICPGATLRIEHSISKGYYCRLIADDGVPMLPSDSLAADIEARMREMAEADMPIVRKERLTKDVVEMFRRQGLHDKVMLLDGIHDLYTVF